MQARSSTGAVAAWLQPDNMPLMNGAPIHPWRLAIGGLLALATAMGIGRFVYTPILPFMTDALDLTKSEAGVIASANFMGYLVGALVAATPWLKGPRRFWLMTGLLASAITTMLTAAWSAVPFLAGIRFVGGWASAFVLVFASSAVLERLNAAGQSRLSSVHFAGVGIGIAVSAVVVALLAGAGHGWKMQWLATGAVALLTVPLVAILVPPDQESRSGPVEASGMRFNPRLVSLITAYGLFGFGYVITATFLVAIVRGSADIRHLEPIIWTIFGLVAVPSVALWAALGRRIGVFSGFALACLLEAVGVLASVLVVNTAGVVVATALLGGTFMGMTALGLVGARALSTSDPRRILALMTVAFGVGQIIGPLVAGVLYDLTGSFTLPSVLAAGALAIAAGLSGALDRRKSAPVNAGPITAVRDAAGESRQFR